MPVSHPDSSDLPPPSATPSSSGTRERPAPEPLAWRANVGLFLATVGSVFCTFMAYAPGSTREAAFQAAQFTSSLLAILLAHEFGHFIAARIHKVDASLPYFIPLPLLSPFGTMGAVIRMRSIIPTRRALLDIGAAGPLAGLALAIPLYAWGAAHSKLLPLDSLDAGVELGDSLLLRVLDRCFGPHIPLGMDLSLSPVAFAGWAGMFVTMINLLPVGQLDGGHVAYALFGPRQNDIARWVHKSMLAFFFVSVTSFVARDVHAGMGLWHLGRHVENSLFWLVWFEVLAILGTLTTTGEVPAEPSEGQLTLRTRAFATVGLVLLASLLRERTSVLVWAAWFGGLAVLLTMEVRWGVLRPASGLLNHPATGTLPLTRGRAVIAVVTLVFFALLFMPTPFAQ